MADELLYFGDSVKALGDGKIAGYLVRYGNASELDLEGDYFSKETELGIIDGSNLPVYYQHGHDGVIKSRRIGRGTIKFDDTGAWLEAQLEMRDEYERMIYQLVESGKMGYSSGAAGHLVEREQVGKSYHIKSWPIAEASLTTTPAEPRNSVIPIKSLFIEKEKNIMEKDEIKTMIADAVGEALKGVDAEKATIAKDAAQEAIRQQMELEAAKAKAGNITVVEDETDKQVKSGKPFKSDGEYFKAVMQAAYQPAMTDKRLTAMKASGLNEATPSEGGFLVQQETANGILSNMWNVGSLLSMFNPISVSGNSLVINAVDETSRVDGSRGGGVLGYWLAEAAQKTATKPAFRQIDLKLKKVAAVCYATDELLEDTTALESWINMYVPSELRFKTEDALINGTGAGMPLGILQSAALVSPTRAATSAISAADVLGMWARRYVGTNDYIWLANPNIAPQIYTMTIGDQPVYSPPGGLSEMPYGRLLGRPYMETEYNASFGTAGDLMLISPSQYAMITKGGIQAATSIHVQFLTDETAFRFVYRVDGQPAWNSAVTPFKGSDTISPFVNLLATT